MKNQIKQEKKRQRRLKRQNHIVRLSKAKTEEYKKNGIRIKGKRPIVKVRNLTPKDLQHARKAKEARKQKVKNV